MCRTVRLDVSAVDGCTFRNSSSIRQGFDQISPEPLVGPAVEAIVDRRVRAVIRRTIAPPAASLEHVDDAGNDTPVIDTAASRLRVSDLLCNCDLIHASGKGSCDDDIQGTAGRVSEGLRAA